MFGPDIENATHPREVLEASPACESGRSIHYDSPIDWYTLDRKVW